MNFSFWPVLLVCRGDSWLKGPAILQTPRLQIGPPLAEAKTRKTLKILYSESKIPLFDLQHGTHLNGLFGALNSPLV